jgi:predicted nucleotidyltransferase
MVGLASTIIDRIVSIILSRRPAAKIILFGSRARGDATPTSDIDIAIVDDAWSRADLDEVHSRLEEEVATALKIDLLALHLVSSRDLVERIQREGVVIHE